MQYTAVLVVYSCITSTSSIQYSCCGTCRELFICDRINCLLTFISLKRSFPLRATAIQALCVLVQAAPASDRIIPGGRAPPQRPLADTGTRQQPPQAASRGRPRRCKVQVSRYGLNLDVDPLK
eukprot:COSAG05_NODE_540_length_8845_cov_13.872742_13_plen_123_part_00